MVNECQTTKTDALGFSEKYVIFFGLELDAVLNGEAPFQGAIKEVLTWIGNHIPGDIQHIESKNSILRAMTCRGWLDSHRLGFPFYRVGLHASFAPTGFWTVAHTGHRRTNAIVSGFPTAIKITDC